VVVGVLIYESKIRCRRSGNPARPADPGVVADVNEVPLQAIILLKRLGHD
jgi:hypothetical protein